MVDFQGRKSWKLFIHLSGLQLGGPGTEVDGPMVRINGLFHPNLHHLQGGSTPTDPNLNDPNFHPRTSIQTGLTHTWCFSAR